MQKKDKSLNPAGKGDKNTELDEPKTHESAKEQKQGLTNDSCQLYDTILLLTKLTNNIITTTTSFTNDGEENELSIALGQLTERFENSIETVQQLLDVLTDEKQRAIVYFLVQNDVCYQSGLKKIFPFLGYKQNIKHLLEKLQSAGIVETIPREEYRQEKELTVLERHRRAFRIPQYHFYHKIVWYRLTLLGKTFFSRIAWESIIPKKMTEVVDQYKQKIAQSTHREVERRQQHESAIKSDTVKRSEQEQEIYSQADAFGEKLQTELREQLRKDEYIHHRKQIEKFMGIVKLLYRDKLRENEWDTDLSRFNEYVPPEALKECIEKESAEPLISFIKNKEGD